MIQNERPALSNSLWTATANQLADYAPLDGDTQTDVAIIGGGYTGLSAALHLAETGANVVLLETRQPGWGASGRNGGQINPGLKDGPAQILARFGTAMGERMIALSGGAADLVFDLIDRHSIDCAASRQGWLRAAHNDSTLGDLHDLARSWQSHGGGMDPLDRDGMARMTGTDAYYGGAIDRRGGTLHPLNYALGLARSAAGAGAQIHGETPVTEANKQGAAWRLRTPRGTLSAERVLICTNAYTDAPHRDLARSFIPVCSVQVATERLPDDIAATVLPGGQHVSDSRRLLLYYRKDAEGRFLMGGRGTLRDSSTQGQMTRLRQVTIELYPHLSGLRWEYAWGGYVAVTRDHTPHLHELAPGLLAGLGYNGRGVAMATAMGREMALWAAGADIASLSFPVTALTPLPFAFARNIALEMEVLRLRLLDRLGI
ncbi:NAD(P)/FAD-dependent oxidoreductase [Marimonas lutisalis]|uniref:NAD(P)/FAD-dependent oxidoreductase n=1 Tax=Marimonas lutisalis TaxID=2545756 RepID=UPI0010FA067B|nr:FAD-dependent oxidoreductase [Marimonas lutisalis]